VIYIYLYYIPSPHTKYLIGYMAPVHSCRIKDTPLLRLYIKAFMITDEMTAEVVISCLDNNLGKCRINEDVIDPFEAPKIRGSS